MTSNQELNKFPFSSISCRTNVLIFALSRHNPYYAKYGANIFGRDFVVGDIHGEFSKLSKLLSSVGFDENSDRLFSVGDLVDRGPESRQVDHWLKKPWFKSVMGNHDYWCVEGGLDTEPAGHRKYGGEWFYSLTSDEQK